MEDFFLGLISLVLNKKPKMIKMSTNYPLKFRIFILFLAFLGQENLYAQAFVDKCGHLDPQRELRRLEILGDNWGYGYDDLLNDLELWGQSDWVSIQSIGESVLGRELWELKITDTQMADSEKKVIYLHARTHPGEVQSTWVCNAVIDFLLSDEVEAEILRSHFVFYLLPMYNPDGVELEYPRENANHVDLESNWYSSNMQKEVLALRERFSALMAGDKAIRVALNLHSAYACKRYFVYHHENGTSYDFTLMEKDYITAAKNDYPEGIQNWDYFVSWTNGTPLQYPESWWWTTHGESVLALTYEDMNCEEAGNYPRTAHALLKGLGDYFFIDLTQTEKAEEEEWLKCFFYPNPTSGSIHISFNLNSKADFLVSLMDNHGRKLKTKYLHQLEAGQNHETMELQGVEPGTYILQVLGAGMVAYSKIVFVKE
jgi:hypothetical protein